MGGGYNFVTLSWVWVRNCMDSFNGMTILGSRCKCCHTFSELVLCTFIILHVYMSPTARQN